VTHRGIERHHIEQALAIIEELITKVPMKR
jgi:hypothetical protein